MFMNCNNSADPRTMLQRRLDGDPMRVKSCDTDTEECCTASKAIEWGREKCDASCTDD